MSVISDFKEQARALLQRARLKYAEGIQITRLENGIEVVSHHIPRLLASGNKAGILDFFEPHQTAFSATVQAGARHEGDRHTPGVAHYYEHLAFRGSENLPAMDESTGTIAELPVRLGAETHGDVTEYWAGGPSKYKEKALYVLSDIVSRPNLLPESVDKERSLILAERIDGTMSAPKQETLRFGKTAFGNSLLPDGNTGIGTRADIEAITHDDILKWRDHYRSGRIVVAAEGNIRHKQLVEMTRRYFSLPPGDRLPAPPQPEYVGGYSGKETAGAEGVGINLLFNCGVADTANTAHTEILSSRVTGTLQQKFRESGLAYNPQSNLFCFDGLNFLRIGYTTVPEKAEKTLAMIHDVLDDISKPADPNGPDSGKTGYTPSLRDYLFRPLRSLKALRPAYTHSPSDYFLYPLQSAKDLLNVRGTPIGARNMAYDLLTKGRIVSSNEELHAHLSMTPDDIRALVNNMREQRPTLMADGNLSGMPDYETVCAMFQIQPGSRDTLKAKPAASGPTLNKG